MKKIIAVGVLIAGIQIQMYASADADLIKAVMKNDISGVARALEMGADPNSRDFCNRTALVIAVGCNYVEIIDLLLQAGARVDAKNDEEVWLLLVNARNQDNWKIFDWTLKAIIGLSAQQDYGILAHTLYTKNLKAIDLVLKAGVNVNAESQIERGWTVLRSAVNIGDAQIINLLLKAGADVNVQDSGGGTALKSAIRDKKWKIVKMLLEAGAEIPDGLDKFEILFLDNEIVKINEEAKKRSVLLAFRKGLAKNNIIMEKITKMIGINPVGNCKLLPLASDVIKERQAKKLQALGRGLQSRRDLAKLKSERNKEVGL